MEKSKKIERINVLIERLENGRTVTRRSLQRVLGESGLQKIESEWVLELKCRTYKPKEIVEYSSRVRKGLIHYALGEKQSFKGESYKAKHSIYKADSILEDAIEYLRDVVSLNSGLRMWIDRDVSVVADIEYCPEGIPRPIWSNSNYKNRSLLPKVTKKDIARDLLETELENLVGREPFELVTCGIRPKRSFNNSSFSDFKF
jgi:hypothetical protein